MNKGELVSKFAEKVGLSKSKAEEAYDTLFEVITDALSEGEKVVVTGFGTFEVKERKERSVVNPQTKQMITVPGFKAATFKPGKLLKDSVK